MDELFVLTVFVVLDDLAEALLDTPPQKRKMTPAEIMTVAVVAARYFHNNLERALIVMYQTGYIPKERQLSICRFNRQLHRHADFLGFCWETLMEVVRHGEAFIIDSLPLPVCKRKRGYRCKKVRGRPFYGYCAAKDEKFFGWRLHLICTPEGLPVAFDMLPGGWHDLTPIYDLTADLPAGASLYGDKAYNDALAENTLNLDGLRLIPIRKKNMPPHVWTDELALEEYRKGIETVNSQLESRGLLHLRARTHEGFQIKVHASLLALWHTQTMDN